MPGGGRCTLFSWKNVWLFLQYRFVAKLHNKKKRIHFVRADLANIRTPSCQSGKFCTILSIQYFVHTVLFIWFCWYFIFFECVSFSFVQNLLLEVNNSFFRTKSIKYKSFIFIENLYGVNLLCFDGRYLCFKFKI